MEHITEKDLEGAYRELRGEVVSRRSDGIPYNHVEEVRSVQNGLVKVIERIQNRLSYPYLSQTERAALVADLSRASKMLDLTEKYVPRQPR